MDAEEGREKKRVNLADDPSNTAVVGRDLHLLPLDMLFEILSRLPVMYLIHFKMTSPAGRRLIEDPGFAQMFHNLVSDSKPCLILFGLDHYFVSHPRETYFVDIEGCSGRAREIDPPPEHSNVSNLVGSCNGLLCFSCPIEGGSSTSRRLLIYNPLVRDAVTVPPLNPPPDQFHYEVFGFGFRPRTGEFKVVRIVTGENSAVQVFTIGTTEWRNTGAPPPELRFGLGLPKALVEESLHWVTDVGMEGAAPIFGIISFDLADERFKKIGHPPCPRFVSNDYSVCVLNGCLSAAGLVNIWQFDIWVMKLYRDEESWEKQFSFDPYYQVGSSRICTVTCALKNGEILLQNEEGSLVSYDPVENRFKTLQISGLPNRFRALPFRPSLFSAKATMNLQF